MMSQFDAYKLRTSANEIYELRMRFDECKFYIMLTPRDKRDQAINLKMIQDVSRLKSILQMMDYRSYAGLILLAEMYDVLQCFGDAKGVRAFVSNNFDNALYVHGGSDTDEGTVQKSVEPSLVTSFRNVFRFPLSAQHQPPVAVFRDLCARRHRQSFECVMAALHASAT